jgi:phosphopantothenoylcysteine decarboxylase/phosphopantothenate--cysteine ligase
MGIALAEACLARAWPVTLLLGPTGIAPPDHPHLKVHRFQTAADLQDLLREHWPLHDLLFMAAAVADYRVAHTSPGKIKRDRDRLVLELMPTPDLVASLAPVTRPDQTIVGFALESQVDLMVEARRKLAGKGLHAIVANPLETMNAADITATLLWQDGRTVPAPPGIPKERFAGWLLEEIEVFVMRRLRA